MIRTFSPAPWVALLILCFTSFAHADYSQRLSLGVGVVTQSNPSQTSFEIGGEYEYRAHPLLGIGVAGNYILSNPSITLIAVPDIFFHPLAGDWLVSAAPLIEFGSGTGTHVGTRLGTRVPLPFGPLTIVPSFAVDFINGGRNLWFGLGIGL